MRAADFLEDWRVHAHSGRSKAGGNNEGFLCDSQPYFPHSLQGGASAQRTSYLREAAGAVEIPVFALGGIHPEHISACMEAGAAGVCMMSEFMCGDLRFFV